MNLFHRRLRRLESPGGMPPNFASILDEGRHRLVSDPTGAARDAEARFQDLLARERDGDLCELEQSMLDGQRRVRAAAVASGAASVEEVRA